MKQYYPLSQKTHKNGFKYRTLYTRISQLYMQLWDMVQSKLPPLLPTYLQGSINLLSPVCLRELAAALRES